MNVIRIKHRKTSIVMIQMQVNISHSGVQTIGAERASFTA